VVCSLISPMRADRDAARAVHVKADLPFTEVFVDTPLAECEARDPKGLYARARAGEIAEFTGISAPYEPPLTPDLHIRPDDGTAEAVAQRLVSAVLGLCAGARDTDHGPVPAPAGRESGDRRGERSHGDGRPRVDDARAHPRGHPVHRRRAKRSRG